MQLSKYMQNPLRDIECGPRSLAHAAFAFARYLCDTPHAIMISGKSSFLVSRILEETQMLRSENVFFDLGVRGNVQLYKYAPDYTPTLQERADALQEHIRHVLGTGLPAIYLDDHAHTGGKIQDIHDLFGYMGHHEIKFGVLATHRRVRLPSQTLVGVYCGMAETLVRRIHHRIWENGQSPDSPEVSSLTEAVYEQIRRATSQPFHRLFYHDNQDAHLIREGA